MSAGIGALKRIKDYTDTNLVKSIYYTLVQLPIDYCCEVWDSITVGLSDRFQKLHNRCAWIVINCENEPGQSNLALSLLAWKTLEEQSAEVKARLMCKIFHNVVPVKFTEIFQKLNSVHHHYLRGSNSTLNLPRTRTEYLKKSITYSDRKICNSFSDQAPNSKSLF